MFYKNSCDCKASENKWLFMATANQNHLGFVEQLQNKNVKTSPAFFIHDRNLIKPLIKFAGEQERVKGFLQLDEISF